MPPARAATLSAAAGADQVAGDAPAGSKVFASYDIFKGKAAVNVKPLAPTFESLGNGSYAVQRSGGLIVEMAPSVAGAARTYDWGQKILFRLSVTELGEILALNPGADSSASVFFQHDPAMGSAAAGAVMKTLKMTQMADGARPGSAHAPPLSCVRDVVACCTRRRQGLVPDHDLPRQEREPGRLVQHARVVGGIQRHPRAGRIRHPACLGLRHRLHGAGRPHVMHAQRAAAAAAVTRVDVRCALRVCQQDELSPPIECTVSASATAKKCASVGRARP
jgi:hypothetical protein